MNASKLQEAIRSGDLKQLQSALVSNSKVCFLVNENNLLHVAAGFGHLDIVKELLKAGASADIIAKHTGKLPIHEACANGNSKILQTLMRTTENLDTQDKNGMTAAHIAAMNGEVECLAILKNADANLLLSDKEGMHPSHWAARRNKAKVLAWFFENGVDLSSSFCNNGRQPLHYAAQYGSIQSLRCLAARLSDMSVEDTAGNQPLHLAAWKNHLDCVRIFVQQGVAPDSRAGKDSRTAAHCAALHGAVESLHWLLDNGVPINIRDDLGNTVGHYACEGGNADCYNCFLRHQGDTSIKNNRGETPPETARRFGHPVLMDKAAKNEEVCPLCNQVVKRFTWEEEHRPPPVITAMKKSSTIVFTSPLGAFESTMQKNARTYRQKQQQRLESAGQRPLTSSRKTPRTSNITGRDLVAKYYGEHVDKV